MKILPRLSIYFYPSFAFRGSLVLPVHDKNVDFFLFFSLPLSFFFLLSCPWGKSVAKQRFQVPGIAITRNRWPEEKEADYFCIDGFAASVLASFSRPGKRICFIHAYIITFANRFRFPSNYYFAKDDSKRIVEQRFLRQELKKGKRNTKII